MILKVGDEVRYIPYPDCLEDKWEKGKVKSLSENDHAFVVYHCNGEWVTGWKNYTAARTSYSHLILGW